MTYFAPKPDPNHPDWEPDANSPFEADDIVSPTFDLSDTGYDEYLLRWTITDSQSTTGTTDSWFIQMNGVTDGSTGAQYDYVTGDGTTTTGADQIELTEGNVSNPCAGGMLVRNLPSDNGLHGPMHAASVSGVEGSTVSAGGLSLESDLTQITLGHLSGEPVAVTAEAYHR
jgi:hypothetical protein